MSVETKSQLAKLLANENIVVQHTKEATASFDVEKRILNLPMYKEMSSSLYDLLVGHEVGHALYTSGEGWHDGVVNNKRGSNFRNFLNVVEDARIEKKVQRKYPGLKKSFIQGFKELSDMDFFGIVGEEVNDLPFIDKFNLHTKSQYTMELDFLDVEQNFVERAKKLESWEEVVTLAEEMYDYSVKEQEEKEEQKQLEQLKQDDNGDMSEGDLEDTKLEEEDYLDDESEPDYQPECVTDSNFRNNEQELIDEKAKENIYLKVPSIVSDKYMMISNDKVMSMMEEHWANCKGLNKDFYKEFKKKNDKFISLLAKEFEMKKAAKVFSKNKLSHTGDLDLNKIFSYKFDDKIFKKLTIVPKGKNHGILFLLDCSASMSPVFADVIEQLLILASFCRKVNIPFDVYGFGDASATTYMAFKDEIEKDFKDVKENHHNWLLGKTQPEVFSSNEGEVCMRSDGFFLKNYISSKLTAKEFKRSMENLCHLAIAFKDQYQTNWRSRIGLTFPRSEALTSTPLEEAIVAMKDVMLKFQKNNNLDIANLLVLQDGDSNAKQMYNIKDDNKDEMQKAGIFWNEKTQMANTVYLTDDKINFQEKCDKKTQGRRRYNHYASLTPYFFRWFTKATGAEVVGYFVLSNSSARSFFLNHLDKNQYDEIGVKTDLEAKKLLKKKGFVNYNKFGYKKFYNIFTKEINYEDETITVKEGKITSKKLKTALTNFNKGRQLNRVLVSRFIEDIAIRNA